MRLRFFGLDLGSLLKAWLGLAASVPAAPPSAGSLVLGAARAPVTSTAVAVFSAL